MSKDTLPKTLGFAAVICIVCSVVVSMAAVLLRPMQDANREMDFKRNILVAAGLMEPGRSIDELFEQITPRIVDLNAGTFTDAHDPDTFDAEEARSNPNMSTAVSGNDDPAKIRRREHYAQIYLVEEGGEIQRVILPVRGYGLWSTLYGFVALENDADTIAGLVFYDHAETPGLGGEVDNPRWRSIWEGKEAYDDEGNVAIEVIKGNVNENSPRARHQVDGLAGATLTSKGVSTLVRYWLGQDGFKPFLENLKAGEV